MKKFFTYIFLFTILATPYNANSGVESIASPKRKPTISPQKSEQDLINLYKEIPDINDKEALKKYLKKRLEKVTKADIKSDELGTPGATSIVDNNEKHKKTISAYEKIYQENMKKAQKTDTLNNDLQIQGKFYREVIQEPQKFIPDFPYVTVKLSDTKEVLAPAEEHIAYLLTTINIESIGLVRVTEEFIFISNNEGFPYGFFRILPKYTYSRANKKRRLDLTLDKVTINDKEYQYKVTEIGNHLHIEPKTPIKLPTGIYTYRFEYIIDRTIWNYDQFDEFYWDITGKTIKNVIGSANAIVTIPNGNQFLGQNVTASTQNGFNDNRVTMTFLDNRSIGFADTQALGVGEDIHLLLTLDKNTITPPSLTKRFLYLIQDFGMEIFGLFALIAIFFAYKISLQQVYKNQDKTNVKIRKTPSFYRLLNTNNQDKHSLGAEILNLYSKNIIDIINKDDEVIVAKKTDDINKLSSQEKNLLKILFPSSETTFSSSKASLLKLKRAYNYIQKENLTRYILLKLRLNIPYILFSLSMLILGFICSSQISINPKHTFLVIFVCSILITPYILLYFVNFKRTWLKILIKIISISSIFTIALWLSIYTSKLYAIITIISIITIIKYYQLFSKRNGLLRNKIKETQDYKTYLQKNTELQSSIKDFITKVPYIYAYGLENKYPNVKIFSQMDYLLKELNL